MRLLSILFGLSLGLLTASVCPYVRTHVHDGAYAALSSARSGVAHLTANDRPVRHARQ
jgi:hypothetical protein